MEDRPEMLGEAGTHALANGSLIESEAGFTERGAMLEIPASIDGLAVAIKRIGFAALTRGGAEAVGVVDRLDAADCGKLEATLAGVGEKVEWAGADDGMGGYLLGSFEVALEIGVLHELHVAKVGKAFATYGIVGEIAVGFDVEAGEVADRVSVFATRETANCDASGIARRLRGSFIEFGANPGNCLLALLIARLRHLGRGHLPLLDGGSDFFPVLEVVGHGGKGGNVLEIQARHCGFAVALKAKLLQDRGGGGGGGGLSRSCREAQCCEQEQEEGQTKLSHKAFKNNHFVQNCCFDFITQREGECSEGVVTCFFCSAFVWWWQALWR